MKRLFPTKTYKLASFTLLEAIVAMFLMVLVTFIGYYSYTTIYKLYLLNTKKSERFVELTLFQNIVSRDFYNSDEVKKASLSSFEFMKNRSVYSVLIVENEKLVYKRSNNIILKLSSFKVQSITTDDKDDRVNFLVVAIKDSFGFSTKMVFEHEMSNANQINVDIDR